MPAEPKMRCFDEAFLATLHRSKNFFVQGPLYIRIFITASEHFGIDQEFDITSFDADDLPDDLPSPRHRVLDNFLKDLTGSKQWQELLRLDIWPGRVTIFVKADQFFDCKFDSGPSDEHDAVITLTDVETGRSTESLSAEHAVATKSTPELAVAAERLAMRLLSAVERADLPDSAKRNFAEHLEKFSLTEAIQKLAFDGNIQIGFFRGKYLAIRSAPRDASQSFRHEPEIEIIPVEIDVDTPRAHWADTADVDAALLVFASYGGPAGGKGRESNQEPTRSQVERLTNLAARFRGRLDEHASTLQPEVMASIYRHLDDIARLAERGQGQSLVPTFNLLNDCFDHCREELSLDILSEFVDYIRELGNYISALANNDYGEYFERDSESKLRKDDSFRPDPPHPPTPPSRRAPRDRSQFHDPDRPRYASVNRLDPSFSTRIDQEVLDILDRFSAATGRSKRQIVEEAIRKLEAEVDRKKADPPAPRQT